MKLLPLACATFVALLALPAVAPAQDLASDKGKLSYALGYRAGLDIATVQQGGETLDMDALVKGLLDAAARKDAAVPPEQLGAAMQALQGRMMARQRAALEQRAAANLSEGQAFLAQNRGKPGVTVLPGGTQVRVIQAGTGPRPTVDHQVTVTFRGTLPDGQVYADTQTASEGNPAGPVTLRLADVPFAGLREAIQQMPAGSRWEIVLPGNQAIGDSIERAGEMANKVLIYDLTLVEVGPVVPAGG